MQCLGFAGGVPVTSLSSSGPSMCQLHTVRERCERQPLHLDSMYRSWHASEQESLRTPIQLPRQQYGVSELLQQWLTLLAGSPCEAAMQACNGAAVVCSSGIGYAVVCIAPGRKGLPWAKHKCSTHYLYGLYLSPAFD